MTTDTTTAAPAVEPADNRPLARFASARHVLLTTYRRDGSPVGTPVHISVAGNIAYIRTFAPSGKLERIRRDARVQIAPCSLRGRVTGPGQQGTVRVIDGDEAEVAARLLAAKYPMLQGRLIPWYHRRKRVTTTHLEFAPE